MSKKILVFLCIFALAFIGCSKKKNDSPYIPPFPSDIVVTGGNNLLEVSWDDVEGADGYIIYIGVPGSVGTPVETTVNTSAVISGLTNGQEYIIMVSSKNMNGRSRTSQNVLGTPKLREAKPSKVTNLTGVAGDASVTLSWAKAAGASEYRIYVNKSGEIADLLTYDVIGLSHRVTGLTNGQAYDFKVNGVNDEREMGDFSDIHTNTPIQPTTPPPAPSLVEVYPANTAVLLTWDVVAGAESYAVYRSLAETGPYTVGNTTSALTANITGLTNGTKYWFKIASINRAGTGSQTTAIGVTPTVQVGIPAAVSGLSASGVGGGISLSWSPTPSADSYRVYLSDTENGNFTLLTDTNQASFSATGLTAGNVYWFKVSAANALGEGSRGVAVAATPVVIPGAPTGLNATAGDGSAVLTWNAGAGATSHKIYQYDPAAVSNFIVIGTVTGDTSSFTATGLTNATTYAFRVESVNSHGNAMSLIKLVTPNAPLVVPPVPSGITATGGNAAVSLTWEAVVGAAGYDVFQSESENGSYVLIGDTRNSFDNITGLTNGTTYWFKIKSVNSVGLSEDSIAVAATPQTPVVVPPVPTGLSGVAANGFVVLSWQYAEQAEFYDIYQSTAGGAYVDIASVSASPFVIAGLANDTEYSYKISGKNSVGSGELSAAISVTPMAPITIPNIPEFTSVYSGDSYVDLTWTTSQGADGYTVYIYFDGNLLSRQAVSERNIRIAELSNGKLYYFEVSAENRAGESANSAGVFSTPTIPPVAPLAPSGLRTGAWDSQIGLKWEAVSGATNYSVHQSTDSVTFTIISTVTSSRVIVTGLTNGTRYYFKVTANNASGASDDSLVVSDLPIIPTARPAAPSIISATTGDRAVILSWNRITGADTYNVYMSPNDENNYSLKVGNVVDAGQIISLLSNGTTYYFKVTAKNSVGESGDSLSVSATPSAPVVVPSIPSRLSATAGDSQATLSWSSSVGALNYNIYRLTEGSGDYVFVTASTSTTYIATGLTNGKKYWFKVSARNTAGESGMSSPATYVLPHTALPIPAAPTGVNAVPARSQVSLSWNAVTGATGYNVYSKLSTGTTYVKHNQTLIASTNYVFTGATNDTAYDFQIEAVNASGVSARSATVTATPVSNVVPAPSGVAITKDENCRVTINWGHVTFSPEIATYTVFIAYNGVNSQYSLLGTVPESVTPHSYVGDFVKGYTYWFKIKANTAASSKISDYSFPVSAFCPVN